MSASSYSLQIQMKTTQESRQRFMLSFPIIKAGLNFWYYFELKIYMSRQFLVLHVTLFFFGFQSAPTPNQTNYWYHQLVQTELPNEPLARQEDLRINRLWCPFQHQRVWAIKVNLIQINDDVCIYTKSRGSRSRFLIYLVIQSVTVTMHCP